LQNEGLVAFDNARQSLGFIAGQCGQKPVSPAKRRGVMNPHRRAAFAVLTPSIIASVCAAYLSFMRKFAKGVFVSALNVREQALQR
jgi:hypothetical protein